MAIARPNIFLAEGALDFESTIQDTPLHQELVSHIAIHPTRKNEFTYGLAVGIDLLIHRQLLGLNIWPKLKATCHKHVASWQVLFEGDGFCAQLQQVQPPT